jgi:hypothetical protein
VVAIVDFVDADRRLATIRIGLGQAPERTWQSRRMEFRAEDEPMERWRSVGLVIGTLAADYTQHPERPRELETPISASPEPPPPSRPCGLSVEGGFVSGVPFNGVPWSVGPFVRGSFRPASLPIGITISLRYEKDIDRGLDFDLELASGSLGGAARVTLGSVGLQFRLELLRQLIVLSAKDDATGTVETRGRWHTGGRVGVDADVHLTGHFFAVGGVDATLLDAPTRLEVRNARQGEVPDLGLAAIIGLRWSSDLAR